MHVRCHVGGRGGLRRKSLRYSGLPDCCAFAAVQYRRRGTPDTSGALRNTGNSYGFRGRSASVDDLPNVRDIQRRQEIRMPRAKIDDEQLLERRRVGSKATEIAQATFVAPGAPQRPKRPAQRKRSRPQGSREGKQKRTVRGASPSPCHRHRSSTQGMGTSPRSCSSDG